MNILPFVAAFLMALAFLSGALFKQHLGLVVEKRSVEGFIKAQLLARSKLESHLYKNHKKKSEPKGDEEPKRPSGTSHSSKHKYRRERREISVCSKLNISPLFAENPPPLLFEATARLLKRLYGDLVKKEGHELLKGWITQAKNKKISTFTDLYNDDPIFYKMLKGTTSYNLETGVGYPALDDFFIINGKEESKAIFFRFAPKVLLESFFGPKLAQKIIDKEMAKGMKVLTKEELESLLSSDFATFAPFINFSQRKPKEKATLFEDAASGITARAIE